MSNSPKAAAGRPNSGGAPRMKPATEILLSAAFVLTPHENFLRGAYFKRTNGSRSWERYDAHADDAVAWCLVAAIDQAALGDDAARRKAFAALRRVITYSAYSSVEAFNNRRTHAEVLDALYRAAELSEAS